MKNVIDIINCGPQVKPLLIDKGGIKESIVLVDGDKILSEDTEIAQTFCKFFDSAVKSLDLVEIKAVLTETKNKEGRGKKALKMYENVNVGSRFSFNTS